MLAVESQGVVDDLRGARQVLLRVDEEVGRAQRPREPPFGKRPLVSAARFRALLPGAVPVLLCAVVPVLFLDAGFLDLLADADAVAASVIPRE
jgi:hypothetical protein